MASIRYSYGSSYSANGSDDLGLSASFFLDPNSFYQNLHSYIVPHDNVPQTTSIIVTNGMTVETVKFTPGAVSFNFDFSDNNTRVAIRGANFDDYLSGGSGLDNLYGGAGNDVIEGGAGADRIDGSTGVDTVSYEHSTVSVVVDLNAGYGREGNASQDDTLISIENVRGSALNDTIFGNAGANTIEGGAGADNLNGGSNAAGNFDTVSYAHSALGVVINLSHSAQEGVGDENGDVLVGFAHAIGSDQDDVLIGNGAVNILEGGKGADYIEGGGGTDTASYEHSASGVIANLGLAFGIQATTGAGDASGDQLVDIANLLGSGYADFLTGDASANILSGGAGNDVLEGGVGADVLDGGSGIDTASYAGATDGVRADLSGGVAGTGDATGDSFIAIENLTGSAFADILIGDDGANRLIGNGGADTLEGAGGNDRLVISGTPTLVDGGNGTDLLFVQGGSTVVLTDEAFQGIEVVYVRNDTHLDMSAVTTGSKITSQSTAAHYVEITGTSGADRIQAGKGGDTIEGGAGGDKLLAGAGADTFHFQSGFGRDNIYGFDVNADHITVDIAGATGVTLKAFHGGQDTIVTFAGVEGTNKIILHDVTMAEIHTAPSDLFTFGA
ncbi:calcium-binding protein [Methylobacterium sp. W2]|uniref:beta strand repeat-containing protein n=1 Tax=Methylobacterium sp. W2 TaxID=2598107 RepID=UPI001D0CD644|nr:hypothetical protein [Methylobacterium sp. W2]MCC0808809.1 calcium-binding protein [Methylobacterium sp. W2]